ncbi:MAG: hypothetical protein N7Q72_03815, partial [Spiroplasma sp. Tabriz.8]|nr:hypothetical protein [Spiroplasma sp. Tabriz.8]
MRNILLLCVWGVRFVIFLLQREREREWERERERESDGTVAIESHYHLCNSDQERKMYLSFNCPIATQL